MKEFFADAVLIAMLTGASTILASGQIPPLPTEGDKQAEREVRRLNGEEVQAFLQRDAKAMGRLWSDDMVVTNPLNKFVTKKQVLGMVESGFLVITSYDRQIEYLHTYGDTTIVTGSETVVWVAKCQMPERPNTFVLLESG